MIEDTDKSVYILLYRDMSTATVVSVFGNLSDANNECLRLAEEASVTLEQSSPTTGPDKAHMTPIEPMRWDTAEGISCWVEQHAVRPPCVVPPPPNHRKPPQPQPGPPPQRKEDSDLYRDYGPRYGDIVVDKKCFSPGSEAVPS
jgi:hypothetical protein